MSKMFSTVTTKDLTRLRYIYALLKDDLKALKKTSTPGRNVNVGRDFTIAIPLTYAIFVDSNNPIMIAYKNWVKAEHQPHTSKHKKSKKFFEYMNKAIKIIPD